jgi:hypothetical protein
MDTKWYLRYIKDDAPPLREFYVFNEKGWLLKNVFYDSDGNWFLDRDIEFSENRNKGYLRTTDFPNDSNKQAPRTKAKQMLIESGLDKELADEWLRLPDELDVEANNKRYDSPQYQEAINTVLEFWRKGKYQ